MKRGARIGIAALATTLVLVAAPVAVLTLVAHESADTAARSTVPSAGPTLETLPSWWAPYPGASVEVPAFFEDDVESAATIVLTSSAAMTEVVEFYRRRLQDAGFVLADDHSRPGVAAVIDAARFDGSEVRLTAVAGSVVILYEEVRRPETSELPAADGTDR